MAEVSGSNPSSPRTLQKFGKYTLIKKLGAGGMAEAFLAQFTGASGFLKTCVIKRMLPHLAQDEQFVRMFHAEAKVAALLTHTNVVQIFELGEIDGTHFIAMEYVDGAPLHLLARTAWRRQRSVPLEVVCCAMADAALGLAAAHELADESGKPLGVIHRDISPDNLMMNKEGVTKVLDFGVAKQIGNEQTAAGELRGKIPFLAPEQLLGKKLDRRADLYALGVTFYWLVTGKRPFMAENEHALMHMIVKTECAPPQVLNPAVPDRVNDLIVQLMSKDPNKRPEDAFTVHDLLADALVARRTLVVPFVREMLSGELAPNNDIAFHTPGFVPSTPHTQSLKDAWSKKPAAKEPPWAAAAKAAAAVAAPQAQAQAPAVKKPPLSASTDLDDPTVAAPYNVGGEPPGRIDLDSLQDVPPTEAAEAEADAEPATKGRIELSMVDVSQLPSLPGAEPDAMDKTVAGGIMGIGIGIGDENVIRHDEQTHAVDPVDPAEPSTMPALEAPNTAPSPRPDLTTALPNPPEVDTLRNANDVLREQHEESATDPNVGDSLGAMPATDPGERALRAAAGGAPFDPFADMGASEPQRPFDRGGGETLPPTPGVVRPQPALSDVLNSDAVRALEEPPKKPSGKVPLPLVPIAAGIAILGVCALVWVISRGDDEAPAPPGEEVVAVPDDTAEKKPDDATASTAENKSDTTVGKDEKIEVLAIDIDAKKKVEEERARAEEEKRTAELKQAEEEKRAAEKLAEEQRRADEQKRTEERREERRERRERREERREEARVEIAAKAPGDIAWQLNGKTIGKGNATLALPAGTASVTAVHAKRNGRSTVPVINGVADYNALPRGKIHPRANPFADVFLGSEALGTTPFPAVEVVAGKYQLRFVHEGKEEKRSVDVKGGETAKVAVDFGGE